VAASQSRLLTCPSTPHPQDSVFSPIGLINTPSIVEGIARIPQGQNGSWLRMQLQLGLLNMCVLRLRLVCACVCARVCLCSPGPDLVFVALKSLTWMLIKWDEGCSGGCLDLRLACSGRGGGTQSLSRWWRGRLSGCGHFFPSCGLAQPQPIVVPRCHRSSRVSSHAVLHD